MLSPLPPLRLVRVLVGDAGHLDGVGLLRRWRQRAGRQGHQPVASDVSRPPHLRAGVDEPAPGATVDQLPVWVRGWAILSSEAVTGVVLTVDGRPVGLARVGRPRPDVAALFGGEDAAMSGWEYELGSDPGVPTSGTVELGGTVHGSAGATLPLPSVTVQMAAQRQAPRIRSEVPPPPCPGASVDEPAPGAELDRLPLWVRGWAMFPSESVTRVEVTVDGQPLGLARVGLHRPDLAAVCGCADAPISGWECEVSHPGIPADGQVTLGGTVHGSAGGTLPLPSVTIRVATRPGAPPMPGRGEDRVVSALADRHSPGTANGPNVLVFTHLLTYGGAQLYLVELLERLTKQGLRFTVVSPTDGPLRERLERAGIAVHLSPMPTPWQERAYDARVAELTAFAAPRAFDLVLVNTISVLYGLEVAARMGLPSVLAVHESLDLRAYWADHLAPHDPAVLDRMKAALASASTVVFEAAATRELFLPYADPERLVTMPYGIDLRGIDRFRNKVTRRAARASLGIDLEKKVVLCLGTIEPRKSQASLARAFARVADRHPEALLALVGQLDEQWAAPYVEGLAQHLERAGMAERVLVTPVTSEPFEWHVASDVLVCASDNESLPRVILEAMAFETLVVSTDIFGIPEVVEDGVTGFLCRSRDEQELAEKLSDVLDRQAEHRHIAAAAADRVRQRHDADAYAAGFQELIDGLLDERRAVSTLVS
ncbi:MAG: UDP-glucose:(heptosyl)LPS alpha,3-glucosyltransferase [Solirubrobacteraceae bacterium]|nr:UDP-glucose:(heptosyl)LPS alpha,3-glucosyltransferase [Solirubrobacteraceae bacterium]